LLNRDGQVIGVVTGLANPDNENVFVGIGFAVPITAAGGAANAPRQ
jgi:S1-C subfamily serine protease